MVTHDPVAAAYADRVVFLSDGRIVDQLDRPGAPRSSRPDGRARAVMRRRRAEHRLEHRADPVDVVRRRRLVALALGSTLISMMALALAATIGGSQDLVQAQSMAATTAGITVCVAVFIVIATFAFAVEQRTRELALLRLVGATPRQIRRMVLAESVPCSAAAAAVVGCAGGCLGAGVLNRWMIAHGVAPAWFRIGVNPVALVIAFTLSVAAALIGAAAVVGGPRGCGRGGLARGGRHPAGDDAAALGARPRPARRRRDHGLRDRQVGPGVRDQPAQVRDGAAALRRRLRAARPGAAAPGGADRDLAAGPRRGGPAAGPAEHPQRQAPHRVHRYPRRRGHRPRRRDDVPPGRRRAGQAGPGHARRRTRAWSCCRPWPTGRRRRAGPR